jgi:hypothetical protein
LGESGVAAFCGDVGRSDTVIIFQGGIGAVVEKKSD